MTALTSCLYLGEVVHRRLAPLRHELRYKVYNLFVDIDELPSLHKRLRLWQSSDVEHAIPPDTSPVYWASPGTNLKTVILAMHKSGTAPLALFEADNRFVGAIGVRDVLQAILRRKTETL